MKTTARKTMALIAFLIVLQILLGFGLWTLWQRLQDARPLPGGPFNPTAATGPGTTAGSPGATTPGGQGLAAGNPLKLPELLLDQDSDPGRAAYVLTAQEGSTEFFPGLKTPTIGYNASYLGPLIRMRRGENVTIQVKNALRLATTIHWHGLVVDGEQDGGPHQGIQPGGAWTPSFTVDQPAATLWFHPHLSLTTANQVHDGLAGLIYIEDEVSDRLALPHTYGVDDFPLIVQDRSFNRNGSFSYQTTMMGVVPGDTILINGTISPYVTVDRGLVRFRILNASNAQNFTFRLGDGSPLHQIASDGGLLAAPVARSSVFLAPAERAEVVVDLARMPGDSVALLLGSRPVLSIRIRNRTSAAPAAGNTPAAGTPGPSTAGIPAAGTPDPSSSSAPSANMTLPATLATIEPIPSSGSDRVRTFVMQSMGISGTINGKAFDMDRIDETVRLGETETWVVRSVGGMGMMQTGGHPFHVHGTQFQVITRNGRSPPPEEQGYKDTIFVDTGEEVVLRVRFRHPGLFMFHCHILEHEDNGMMGQFIVQ